MMKRVGGRRLLAEEIPVDYESIEPDEASYVPSNLNVLLHDYQVWYPSTYDAEDVSEIISEGCSVFVQTNPCTLGMQVWITVDPSAQRSRRRGAQHHIVPCSVLQPIMSAPLPTPLTQNVFITPRGKCLYIPGENHRIPP